MQIPGISSVSKDGHAAAATDSPLAITSFDIPLTGSVCQLDILLDLSKDERRDQIVNWTVLVYALKNIV